MSTKIFKVPDHLNGARIDVALLELHGEGISRRKVRLILDVGGVYLQKKRVRIASRTVRSGDTIKMEYSEGSLKRLKQMHFEITPKDILFEDPDIIAIYKAPGLPAQATKDQSLMHAPKLLREYLKKRDKSPNLYLENCHRLDKETSGIMLFAKNKETLHSMMEKFKTQNIHKIYQCISWGKPKSKQFTVEAYLSDINPKNGTVRVVKSGGKPSKTNFKILEGFDHPLCTFLEANPKTGRTHQIRVHLQYMNLPILGDKIYAKEVQNDVVYDEKFLEWLASHHMLHAQKIEFEHPKTKQKISIEAPLPNNFSKLLEHLRKKT